MMTFIMCCMYMNMYWWHKKTWSCNTCILIWGKSMNKLWMFHSRMGGGGRGFAIPPPQPPPVLTICLYTLQKSYYSLQQLK